MATPKKDPAAKPAQAPEFPTVDIIERRIASGGRNLTRPRQVQLIGQPEPMSTRIVNTAIDSRWYQVTSELGWVPVTPEEVAGGMQGDMRAVDGRVVLGEHGREVLVKMPTRLYKQIQHSRAQKEHRDMTSKSKFRARTMAALERDAKDTDRAGSEQLERASELLDGTSKVAHLHVEEFNVSKEYIPLGDKE